MKRIMRIGLLIFFAALFAAPSIRAGAYDYTIEKYQVTMKVTTQNVYRIQETITVDFNEARHGIYRDIPVVNEVKRLDGSSDRIIARVENISCGEDDYETSREGNTCQIKIGDEDETITGEKIYHISYDYVMGNDVLDGNDEFYFNVIGTEWQTRIKNVSFSIEMPKEFEEENLGMSYGSYSSDKYDDLYYYIDENTIYGELDSDVTLRPEEGVTVRLLLPEGYFEKTEVTPWLAYGALLLGAVSMALAFILWWIYGRDDPVVETVEFYAPDGLNSVELAFAYKGTLDNSDVVSLIVYLAQKGYIEIREGTEDRPKKGFTLVRRKQYDGTNEAERLFMEGLFRSGDKVTKKDLQDSFYKTINKIVSLIDCKENKEKIFYANSLNKGRILMILTFVVYFLAGIIPISQYEYSFVSGICISLGVGALFTSGFASLFSQGKVWVRIILFAVLCGAGVIVYQIFAADAFEYANGWYRAAYWFAVFASGVNMFFDAYMSKRTEYGNEMLGRIGGFKNFLETAEKDRLEAMVSENPQYFYEILPYTYVLDISDKWMKKFASIAVEPPTWYYGYQDSMFDMVIFSQFMNSTMSTAATSMTSSPSSSSGGGFSGGGSGGGGGGSW